jgi:hypothetical protein
VKPIVGCPFASFVVANADMRTEPGRERGCSQDRSWLTSLASTRAQEE